MEREAAADSSKDVIASQNMATKDLVIIEIPEDTIDDKKWSKCVIFRVPRILRDSGQELYTPRLVSIGPFHYGREKLKGMECHKQKYLEKFCERKGITKEKILNVVRKQSNEILASYAGTIEMDDLENIILRDACFILELFCRQAENNSCDYILETPWLKNAIKMDLILLENQLPFNILKKIYDVANHGIPKNRNPEPDPDSSSTRSLSDQLTLEVLTIDFFEEYSLGKFANEKEKEYFIRGIKDPASSLTTFPKDVIGGIKDPASSLTPLLSEDQGRANRPTVKELTIDEKKEEKDVIKHFTDLVRLFWIPENWRDHRHILINPKGNYLYSAKQLDKVGVSFAPAKENDKSVSGIADVKFEEKYCECLPLPCCPQIKLPLLTLDGKTELLMRNVMALEQCFYRYGTFICNYISLMNELMKTEEDVDFLVEKKIVKNLLGSNREAATLLNELCDNITEQSFIYADECEDLNKFYENWFNKTRGTIKRVYFKDLWTTSTTIVGLFVFIFTVSATVKSLFFS